MQKKRRQIGSDTDFIIKATGLTSKEIEKLRHTK
jgi:hypothetical protein